MKTVNASEFKARCLAILDEVRDTREMVTILKRGKPVAQLIPPIYADECYPQRSLEGSVKIVGDIVSPPVAAEDWEALDRSP